MANSTGQPCRSRVFAIILAAATLFTAFVLPISSSSYNDSTNYNTSSSSPLDSNIVSLTQTEKLEAVPRQLDYTPKIHPSQQQERIKLKILWISISARNKTSPSNIAMYELNAGGVTLALREARETGLLDPNTTDVEVVYRDITGTNSTQAMVYALSMNATPGSFQLMLGPAESVPARNVDFLMQAMRKPHIVWGSLAPELSDRIVHKNVIRPQQNMYLTSQCIAQFFVSQNMTTRISILYYDNIAPCVYMAATFKQTSSSFNITVSDYVILTTGMTDEELSTVLTRISGESRVIFGCGMFEATNFTRNLQFYRLVAAAKKLGMTDSSYQWLMVMADFGRPVWHPLNLPTNQNFSSPAKILKDHNIPLTLAELAEALKHVIYFYPRMSRRDDLGWGEKVLNAITEPPWNENMTQVRADLRSIGVTDVSSAYVSGHLADSITLYLKGVQIARASGRDYTDPYAMYDILRNITFDGHSGYFALNREGERLPDLALHGPSDNYDSKSMRDKFEEKGTMRCSIQENIKHDSNVISGRLELEKPFIWYTPDGLPPPSVPTCGYRGELCRFNFIYIVFVIVAGFLVVSGIVGTMLWIAVQQRRKAELLRMDWLLQAGSIEERTPTRSFVGGGLSRSNGSNPLGATSSSGNPSLAARGDAVGRDSFMSGREEELPKSVKSFGSGYTASSGHSEDGYDADETEQSGVTIWFQNCNFTCATYQGAQVSLYKWSWSPAANLIHRNLSVINAKKASGGGQKGLLRSSSGASSNTLVTFVLEHRECLKELLAMRRVHHDNVCLFIGAYYENETRQLVYVHSYCHKGTLSRVIQRQSRQKQPLQWFFKQSIILDIALGLEYLQNSTQLEFHGRLRSQYIVIDSRWVTKITGFGRWSFGIEHPEDDLLFTSNSDKEVEAHKRRLLWTAPEILRQPSILSKACATDSRRHTSSSTLATKEAVAAAKKADVYSFGVIISEVMYDIEPYSERFEGYASMTASEVISEVLKVPKSAQPLCRPWSDKDDATDDISSEEDVAAIHSCRRLMTRCWAEDAAERPSAKNVAQSLRTEARVRADGRGTGSLVDTVIAKLEKYAKNLESLVQTRTNDLQEEKRRADGLLRRLLPESIAEQLKRGEAIIPQMYESTSVYFSDIVSFTTIASLLTPLAVVDVLNGVIMYMDDVLSRYAVYKMETIGDGYMVVSGLPQRISTHAEELASMALDIRNGLGSIKFESLQHQPHHKNISIRLGLHSGPVVAGVVGLTMPRYCLFGDTVNVASRMESQGEAMQIQISESTRQLLGAEYIGRERGVVQIKGKGIMHTYWLDEGPMRVRNNNNFYTNSINQ